MMDEQKKEESSSANNNGGASAPLVSGSVDQSQIVIDDNRPPPPYYEPLPPINLNTQQPIYNNQPSMVILAPLDYHTKLGSSPVRIRCPNCSAEILTQTRHKSGCMTWAICGSLCAIGLFVPCAWLGCQFIPFCINSCKDVKHICPNCQAYLGTYDRLK